MTIRNLDALLRPSSVVVVGASGREGSVGHIVARNIVSGPFKGAVTLVNPRRPIIAGCQAVGSLAEMTGGADLAVIATPAGSVSDVVAAVGARGTRAAVVITAGLNGSERQRMLDAARPHLLRVQGPNCIGLMLPAIGLNASFCHIDPLPGGLAFLSQSGALITGIVDWATARGIGFSHILSLGDMADVDFGDALDYLAGNNSAKAILLYIESVTHAQKFMSAARRAARIKPVIVVKSGRHAAGARAAMSHTGALAGSDAAYDAAFRRAGLVRVPGLYELFEAAEMLARLPRLKGERLTILTNGGGAGVLAADRVSDHDGELAELSSATQKALDDVLPANWSRANPIDIIGDAPPERYRKALDIVLADPAVEAVLVLNCPTALASSTTVAKEVVAAVAALRPAVGEPASVMAGWLGGPSAEGARNEFLSGSIPVFETPSSAVDGFMNLVNYRRSQDELLQTPPAVPGDVEPDAARVSQIIADVLASGRTLLSEPEAKEVLSAYAIDTVETVIATDPEDVGRKAGRIIRDGQEVVVKILSNDISHKSDVGGVRLSLKTSGEAEEAARSMLDRITRVMPGARIDGFTVQAMVRRRNAHELIAGMSVDTTFGPMITFGAGGTAVEVIRDTAQALVPLDMGLARNAMRRTRIYRLLEGYRDRTATNIDAVAAVLVRLGALAARHEAIREVDINPLLADDKGVLALDARIVVSDPELSPRTAMAIRPYPVEWERTVTVDGVASIFIRPVRPEDEALYQAFFALVSPNDMRLRFLMAKPDISQSLRVRLTQIDYSREMAFVALDPKTHELLGVVRMIADPDYVKAEYAVLVRSDLKGKGLGWQLMQQIIDYARAEGLQELFGSVLAENGTMLRMAQELGFRIEVDHDDRMLRSVILRLDQANSSCST